MRSWNPWTRSRVIQGFRIYNLWASTWKSSRIEDASIVLQFQGQRIEFLTYSDILEKICIHRSCGAHGLQLKLLRLDKGSLLLVVSCISFPGCTIRSSGKSVGPNLLGTEAIRDDKVEAWKQYTPTSLSLIQYLGRHEVLKVLVIGVDRDRMLSSFKKMTPLLERVDNG